MSKTVIKPTVGRTLWFRKAGTDPKMQAQAAIVCYVHSDTCVNLSVYDVDGHQSSATSVYLSQSGTPPAMGDWCEWMPYQKQVAAGEIPPVQHAT